MPLVSIIVPAYNHEKYVVECLQSLADQTYPEIEVLVFDDGSKDGTRAVIEAFLATTKRPIFKFVSKPNEGLCATLNAGIRNSRGHFITIVASDDAWHPEKLERQVRCMEANPSVGLVFTDAQIVLGTELTTIKWSDYKRKLRSFFRNGIATPGIYGHLMAYNFIPALTVMMRKSVLETVGGFDENLLYEDLDMWLRFISQADLAYIDEPLARYRMHDTNISNNNMFMLKGYLQTLRKHLKSGPLKKKPLLLLRTLFAIVWVRISSKITKAFIRRQR
jgi:alpha-1,3-rhamnosyltransferase